MTRSSSSSSPSSDAPLWRVTITLNDRLDDEDLNELYKAPLAEALRLAELGRVRRAHVVRAEGAEHGEPLSAVLELEVIKAGPQQVSGLTTLLTEYGAPRGSSITVHTPDASAEEAAVSSPVGALEGLALYLDGVNLSRDAYKTYSLGDVWEAVDEALGETGAVHGSWSGPEESALYLFGESYEALAASISPLLARHPMCRNARHVPIT